MAALVGEHPDARHDRALGVPVHGPEEVVRPDRHRGVGDEGGQVEEGGDDGEVGGEVSQRGEQVPVYSSIKKDKDGEEEGKQVTTS